MRLLAFIFLVSLAYTFGHRYHEKTRFDRSIYDDTQVYKIIDKKPRIFTDRATHYTAYKDAAHSVCYLKNVLVNEIKDDANLWREIVQNNKKKLYASDHSLTKIEAWRLAGGRVVDFCRGMTMILLQSEQPAIIDDPFFNELPEDENGIIQKRVADVVLTPLKVRTRRRAILEERERVNHEEVQRKKREISPYRGRFRGQTQSQYLNVGNGQKEGKAQAEATQQSSRAIVSGSSGMGQAQSMSTGGDGCEGCPGYDKIAVPPSLQGVPGSQQFLPTAGLTYPTGGITSGAVPGTLPGIQVTSLPAGPKYPGGTIPTGTQVTGTGAPGVSIPSGISYIPSTQITGAVPGLQIPTGSYPATQVTGGTPGIQIPTVLYPQGTPIIGTGTSGTPGTPIVGGTGSGVRLPSGVVYQPGISGGGSVTGPQASGTGLYPQGTQIPTTLGYPPSGKVIGSGTTPNIQLPSGLYPPGSQIPTGISYRPGTQVTGGGTPAGILYPPGTQVVGGTPSIGSGQIPGGISYPTGTQVVGTVPGTGAGQTSGGISYPPGTQIVGGIPSGQTPGGIPYPAGTQIVGSIPSAGSGQTPGGISYPPGTQILGGIPSTGPGQTPGGISYPPGTRIVGGTPTIGTGQTPGQITYPPGTQVIGGGSPGSQIPGGVIYPPGSQLLGGGVVYPPGTQITGSGTGGTQIPGISFPGIQIPSDIVFPSGTQISGGGTSGAQSPVGTAYPPGTQIVGSGITGLQQPGGSGWAPGTQIPGIVYPPGTQIVGSGVTGQQQPGGSGWVPGTQIPGIAYPPGTQLVSGGTPVNQISGGVYPPGTQIAGSGTPQLPSTIYPPGTQITGTGVPTTQLPDGTQIVGGGQGLVNTDMQKPISRGDIPGTIIYPGQPNIPTQSGFPAGSGLPIVTPGAGSGLPPVVTAGQVGIPGGVANIPGQYPNVVRTPGVVVGTGGGQVDVTGQQTNVVIGADDGSDSQALSSVKQGEAGTQASASAEGRHAQGTATSQVSGIYTGSGSFQAQAGTSDNNKSAQTQVSGGKEGAKSSAQGSGGLGKSQTQVELDSSSGATSTNAQSSGWNHGTNSQVQASAKGGMADAQANGEGQTSSQAQIGFQPYINQDEKVEQREKPFRGGGTASAQSGTYRGQSQSQLQGSFHYGITYSGAAQAGSGSGAAALRKPFNFSTPDPNLFKPYNLDDEKPSSSTPEPKEGLEASSSRQTVIAISSKNSQPERKNKPEQTYEPNNNEDEYEEYEDEEYVESTPAPKRTTTSATRQTMRVVTDGDYDVRVHQEKTTDDPNRSLPGYAANRNKAMSMAGRKIIVQGDGKSQSQTVSIIPVTPRADAKGASTDTRSLHPDRLGGIYYGKNVDQETATTKTSYVSVSNSVAGKIDDKNPSKKYEHRYYTKSSTCGYFTFSCNIVYGSNGKRKICKPKMPTNSDGTPKC